MKFQTPLLALTAIIPAIAAAEGSQSILQQETARQLNESLLWGTYRPNLYFGVKPRLPKSFMGGLMWSKVESYADVQHSFRHTCEQGDDMSGYGWEEYDPRKGGVQLIRDHKNGLDITTLFTKVPGGKHGGSWTARIRGMVPEGGDQNVKTTVVFTAGLAGIGSLELVNPDNTKGYEEVEFKGNSEGLGEYTLTITEGRGKHPKSKHESAKIKNVAKTLVHSMQVSENDLWQTKALLFQQLKTTMEQTFAIYGQENPPPPFQVFTVNHNPGPGNLHLVQKVFEGAFEFDIIFNSGSSGKTLYSSDISAHITSTQKSFYERLIATHDPQFPFAIESLQRFTSNMFSNLIGGLGYFYGDQLIDRSYASEYEEDNEGFVDETAAARARKAEQREGPYELLTTVPSRPFFPRGFLWDEGFHLSPIIDWDLDLTLEIVKSWFGLMDEDGWIGREQILGSEARSKVPAEFQVQYPHYANPPTLFFVIDEFIAKLGALNGTAPEQRDKMQDTEDYAAHLRSTELAQAYLAELYPKLKKHYYWFRKTQHGDLKSYERNAFSTKEGYRWRGRSVQHILTSGLDDYPRPQPPHPGELHVDLISWMGMMTKSLKNVASFLDYKDDVAELAIIDNAITRNIDDLHWNAKERVYCDATIDEYEEHALVCHRGYISLFPFLMGLMDEEGEKLGHVLDLIADEEELWSPYGIRSLSKKDEKYGTDENYWRGPIWININYLVLKQLLRYALLQSPHAAQAEQLYNQLRINVVKNVYENWEKTQFAWEQYHPETGVGQRTQHFTGWTSLVVKIMAMPDLSGGKVGLKLVQKEREGKDEL